MNIYTITLANDFHGTETTIKCPARDDDNRGVLTIYPGADQIKRAKQRLCGIKGCTCSDDAGCRGPQKTSDGRAFEIDMSSLYAR